MRRCGNADGTWYARAFFAAPRVRSGLRRRTAPVELLLQLQARRPRPDRSQQRGKARLSQGACLPFHRASWRRLPRLRGRPHRSALSRRDGQPEEYAMAACGRGPAQGPGGIARWAKRSLRGWGRIAGFCRRVCLRADASGAKRALAPLREGLPQERARSAPLAPRCVRRNPGIRSAGLPAPFEWESDRKRGYGRRLRTLLQHNNKRSFKDLEANKDPVFILHTDPVFILHTDLKRSLNTGFSGIWRPLP
jgi:hypothetical protein